LQSLPAWNAFFNTPASLRLGVFAATLFLPGIPGVFLAEAITTRFGRRVPIWIGCILVIVGSIIMTCSQNEGMFLACA
jgi:MFS family permease